MRNKSKPVKGPERAFDEWMLSLTRGDRVAYVRTLREQGIRAWTTEERDAK